MTTIVRHQLRLDVNNVNTTGTDFTFYLHRLGHPLTVSLPQVLIVQRGPTSAYHLYQIFPDANLLASTLSQGLLPGWTFLVNVVALIDSTWSSGKATGTTFFEKLIRRGERVSDLGLYVGGSYTVREFVGMMLAFILAYEVFAWVTMWVDSYGFNFSTVEQARVETVVLANNTQVIAVVLKDDVGIYPSPSEVQDVINAAYGKGTSAMTISTQNRIVKLTSIFRTPCTNLAYSGRINTEVAKNSRHLYFEAFDVGGYNLAASPEFMRHTTVNLILQYFSSNAGGSEFLDLLSKVARAFGLSVASRVVMVYHGGDRTQPNHLHVEFTPRQSIFAAKFKYRPGV